LIREVVCEGCATLMTGDYELQSDMGTPAGSVGPGSTPVGSVGPGSAGGGQGTTPGATPASAASVDIFTSHLPR